ncbi:hypothetical protein V5799_013148 [Amblyomma americanum]|uniref:Uncharacterized protein n=1 Tax=Amblyomma americanum TaxID=6943 RepID=A0AAQ4E6V7_AMBAM
MSLMLWRRCCDFAETDQETQPRELPVVGDVHDIELSIQSSSYDVFQLLGKRLILKRPLDRDNDGYEYFAIDLPYQGLVTIARPLDYERAKYYHLLIKATVRMM